MLEVHQAPLPPFGDGGYHKMAGITPTTTNFDHAEKKCSEDLIQSSKSDLMISMETVKEEVVPTETLKSSTAYDATSIPDMEAAKKAAAFVMNIPEVVVQLVIDAHRLHLDPSLAFTDSKQLAQAALEVSCSPQRQADLTRKIHRAQMEHKKQQEAGESAGAGLKAAAKLKAGDDRDDAGSDCTKHLAGMSEVSQSAAACKTSPSSTSFSVAEPSSCSTSAKQDDHRHHHQQSLKEQDRVTSASSPHSKIVTEQTKPQPPAAEMLHGNAKAPTTASTLADVTTATPDPKQELRQKLQVLAAENRKLKNRKLCRACQKVDLAESGITFLPCGHFITCESCSEMFDDCPACGKNIMGTVRTFLS